MQEAGERLKLQYVEVPHGPYAENLSHVLRVVEGHLISGYEDGGDALHKQLELVPGAVVDAKEFLKEDKKVRDRFDCVADLVGGFETPFGLELLSPVHWVVSRTGSRSREPMHGMIASVSSRSSIKLPLKVLSAKD